MNIIPGGSSYSDIAVNNTVKSRSNSDKEGIKQVTINSTDNVELISPGTSYSEAFVNGEPANIQKQSDPSGRKTNSKQSKSKKHNSGKKTPNPNNIENRPWPNQEQTSQILIIGYSILSGINPKGLKNNVDCRSFSGATISTLMEKIQLYDLKSIQDIVLYIAGNDASQTHRADTMLGEKVQIEYIENRYEQLITHIKDKNPNINIYLCSLCPRRDTDVVEVNDVIKQLSETHSCIFVDINKTFYKKHDQLNVHFYKPRDNIHISLRN